MHAPLRGRIFLKGLVAARGPKDKLAAAIWARAKVAVLVFDFRAASAECAFKGAYHGLIFIFCFCLAVGRKVFIAYLAIGTHLQHLCRPANGAVIDQANILCTCFTGGAMRRD